MDPTSRERDGGAGGKDPAVPERVPVAKSLRAFYGEHGSLLRRKVHWARGDTLARKVASASKTWAQPKADNPGVSRKTRAVAA